MPEGLGSHPNLMKRHKRSNMINTSSSELGNIGTSGFFDHLILTPAVRHGFKVSSGFGKQGKQCVSSHGKSPKG